jgi:hypothetical protein
MTNDREHDPILLAHLDNRRRSGAGRCDAWREAAWELAAILLNLLRPR